MKNQLKYMAKCAFWTLVALIISNSVILCITIGIEAHQGTIKGLTILSAAACTTGIVLIVGIIASLIVAGFSPAVSKR